MKVSDSISWHYLSCKSSTVIEIYKAWDYLDDCSKKYYFKNNAMYDLKDTCNGYHNCRYIKFASRRKCYRWWYYYYETKSRIQYNCIPYPEIMETTTPVTLPSSEATKVTTFTSSYTQSRSSTTSNQNYSTNGRMNTTMPVTSTRSPLTEHSSKSNGRINTTTYVTRSPLTEHSSKSNDAVIAGSVFGVLGVLVLILLLVCLVLKRRKADKHKATRPGNVTNAVGQNSNVVYVVSGNVLSLPGRIDDEPPAYHTLDDIPGQNHIYINDDHRINQTLKHQHTNNYNHIHGTVGRNSPQNDNYNHTNTETVNISGGQRDNYNHISVSRRNADVTPEIEDNYNHIRSIEGVRSHDIGDYNHIGGQTDGEENRGYMEDDYNHLDNSNRQNTSEREQPSGRKSNSENDYANIGIKEGNNGIDDFEPDDTYVYS